MSSSNNNTEFDLEGFILCLAVHLLGPEMVEKNLLLHPSAACTAATPTNGNNGRGCYWRSPLLVNDVHEEAHNSSDTMKYPVIVSIEAIFQYDPSNKNPSSSSKLSLQWGALMYNNKHDDAADHHHHHQQYYYYYYVESAPLTYRDLAQHFVALDVHLDDLDNDITVLARAMAKALLMLKTTTSSPAANNDNNKNMDDDDSSSTACLKQPLYYQDFENSSFLVLANDFPGKNREKENEKAATVASTLSSATSATISPLSIGAWNMILDLASKQQQPPPSDKTNTETHSTKVANGEEEASMSASSAQDPVQKLLELYNQSYRHAVMSVDHDDDGATDKGPNVATASTTASPLPVDKNKDPSSSPTISQTTTTAATTTTTTTKAKSPPTTKAAAVPAKKKTKTKGKGMYFKPKKAKKPATYAHTK